ncbi:hypothetical protein [Rhodopila sp.]|uniref:hypothetical protein n=1 Tax=Rhodopila sp. TaxID=2480087 RepID=UPI003D0F62BD
MNPSNDDLDDHAAKFNCVDCGLPVISFTHLPSQPHRCAACGWLAALPDDMEAAEKAELRAMMRARGVIGDG